MSDKYADMFNVTLQYSKVYSREIRDRPSAETLKQSANFVDSFTNDKRDSLTNGKRRDNNGVTKKEDNKKVQKVNNEIDIVAEDK